tara:strand:+ start:4970 stop:5455 length:486 start_codon:yes stop_codon:yes gene_type:complete
MADHNNNNLKDSKDFEQINKSEDSQYRRKQSFNRDSGGFRIRLSDNEMKAAKAIQESFNLRSTVAVLGFSIRTLGEMIENGSLNDVISKYKSESIPKRSSSSNHSKGLKPNKSEVDPFARPSRPSKMNEIDNSDKLDGDNLEGETGDKESIIKDSLKNPAN